MIRTAPVRRSLVISALLSATLAACSTKPNYSVRIEPDPKKFSLVMHTNELEGSCYAPEAIQLNPSLEFAGFSGTNRWTAAKTDNSGVEDAKELDYFLSANRMSIGHVIELPVPRDFVVKRPFDIQFVAFPCDAPPRAKGWKGKIFIVAVRADLPAFVPPGYRIKRHDDDYWANQMMHNESSASKRQP